MTPRLHRLFKIAYVFSGATFGFALLCLVSYLLRWCGASFLSTLSENAGYVGCAALGALAGCFVTMLKASQLTHELHAQREAAERASEPSTADRNAD